jgi:hypothetical protein
MEGGILLPLVGTKNPKIGGIFLTTAFALR